MDERDDGLEEREEFLRDAGDGVSDGWSFELGLAIGILCSLIAERGMTWQLTNQQVTDIAMVQYVIVPSFRHLRETGQNEIATPGKFWT